jgi:hypothetical protein
MEGRVDHHQAGERRALAVFCAAVPALRARAARGFWEDTLDMHISEIAAGASALDACEQLGLRTDESPEPPVRGDHLHTGGRTDWLPPPSLVGDYRCPTGRCGRRADRDEQAKPPRCAVSGAQMRFVRGDGG